MLYFLTSLAGCTSRCPYRHTVFFLGSEPSCPSNTGGSGICVPSGSVCLPTSHSSVVPPSFSISCKSKDVGTFSKLFITLIFLPCTTVFNWQACSHFTFAFPSAAMFVLNYIIMFICDTNVMQRMNGWTTILCIYVCLTIGTVCT